MENPNQQLYIEGPVALSELKDTKYNKHIYIFSDIHVREKICVPQNVRPILITNFIKQVISDNPDKVIDFFLEVDFASTDPEITRERDYSQFGRREGQSKELLNAYIWDLRNELYDCFQIDKKLCPDKRTRYQWSDARSLGIFREWTDYLTKVNSPILFMAKLFSITDSLINEGKQLIARTPTDINELYRIARVDKQLANIPYPEIKQIFHNYFDRAIQDEMLNVKNYFNSLTNNSTIDELKDGIMFLLSAMSNLMDAYVMARIFRTFDKPQKGRQPGPAPDNVIIYAGRAHTDNMLRFLNKIPSMQTISYSTSDKRGTDFQCLKLAAKVPFFGGYKAPPRETALFTALRLNDAATFIDLIKGTRYDAMLSRGGYTLFVPSDSAFMDIVLPGLNLNSTRDLARHPRFDNIIKSHIVDRPLNIQQLKSLKIIKTIARVEFYFENDEIESTPILNSFQTGSGAKLNIIHIIDGMLISEDDLAAF